METKIKNIISFLIIPNKMKYLGVSLIKHVQDLHPKNCKIFIKADLKNQ